MERDTGLIRHYTCTGSILTDEKALISRAISFVQYGSGLIHISLFFSLRRQEISEGARMPEGHAMLAACVLFQSDNGPMQHFDGF